MHPMIVLYQCLHGRIEQHSEKIKSMTVFIPSLTDTDLLQEN